MGCWVVAVIMCMMMASAADHAQAAISSCSDVTNYVLPCLSYASSGGQISSACCAGVTKLNNAAQTTADRQTACNCLKQLSRTFSFKYAADIPANCGLSLPYKIDPNIDCTTVT